MDLTEEQWEEFKRLRQEVRKILLNEWDPLGVKGFPHAQDQYDEYLHEFTQFVWSDSSLGTIVDRFENLERHRMGLNHSDRSRLQEVAKALKSLNVNH